MLWQAEIKRVPQRGLGSLDPPVAAACFVADVVADNYGVLRLEHCDQQHANNCDVAGYCVLLVAVVSLARIMPTTGCE